MIGNKIIKRLLFCFRNLARPEFILLALGFICTVISKGHALSRLHSNNLFLDILYATCSDALFFIGVASLILLFLPFKYSITSRAATVVSALIAIWSIFNFCWLFKNTVQLQPRLLMILFRDMEHFWPVLKGNLIAYYPYTILLSIMMVIFIVILLVFTIYPLRNTISKQHCIKWGVILILFTTVMGILHPLCIFRMRRNVAQESMSFSSHWYAIASLWKTYRNGSPPQSSYRIPPVKGKRILTPPPVNANPPNIVMILMESISYAETSLANPSLNNTPAIKDLARRGIEFICSRAPVSHTTKALWTIFTGTYPVIESDFVEAVPQEVPYEGLPSILSRIGYRSAFFEMPKGSFECAPGLMHNLNFDYAFFRENLNDPSSYLTVMSGDDFQLIDPAVQWISQSSQPFLLVFMTSVAHDPYVLPEWFEKPLASPLDCYRQTVRYTDNFVKNVYDKILSLGHTNTLFCILGDHGTSFRTEEGSGRWIPYEEVIRIPWFILWEGHVQAGTRVSSPCFQTDITPTLLSLLGFDVSNAGFDGYNACGPIPSDRKLFFSSWFYDSPMGYIQYQHKYVYWPYLDNIFQYDLSVDPNENNPVMIANEKVALVKKDILAWQKQQNIFIDKRRFYQVILYDHWRTIGIGRSAWAYYLP